MPDAMLLPDACIDSDNDGVCNTQDVCAGHDDKVDADADTIADGCDVCPSADDRPDVNANSVPDCSELQTATINVKVVGSNVWRGWHASSGPHDTVNDNTLTGVFGGTTYNSYFTFTLAGFTASVVTKVTLELQMETYSSSDANETFSVWDVTSTASAVESTASSSTIFADLQSGTQYATAMATAAQLNQVLSIPLNAQAATDAKAKMGTDFTVGVHLDTAAGQTNYIRFGHTPANENPTINRVVVQYLP